MKLINIIITITILLLAFSLLPVNAADVFRYGNNIGYDYNTDATVNQQKTKVELYNYNTGTSVDVDLRQGVGNSQSGSGYNYQTGKFFDVDVDSTGNVDIFEYYERQ